METGINGLNIIKRWESYRAKPYLCTSGKPTIGYGSTFYEDGTRVTMSDPEITEPRAVELLKYTLQKIFEPIVNNSLKVKINQNKFDALVSHTYNTGGSETMFRLVNENATALNIWKWFTEHYITSNGVFTQGLLNRRKAEAILFQTP